MKQGFVYIVGAGPGDPDLITVKGRRCVRQADVILHDRLIHPGVLAEARPKAILIDAGKRFGHEDQQQAEIHDLMINYAREGNVVCRLKGGDPFIFGRGGEEVAVLKAAGSSVSKLCLESAVSPPRRQLRDSADPSRLHSWLSGDHRITLRRIRYPGVARSARSAEGRRNSCRADGSGAAGSHRQKPD